MNVKSVKYKGNITFHEAKKIVEPFMKENTYATDKQQEKTEQTRSFHWITSPLNPKDWPKFQE